MGSPLVGLPARGDTSIHRPFGTVPSLAGDLTGRDPTESSQRWDMASEASSGCRLRLDAVAFSQGIETQPAP